MFRSHGLVLHLTLALTSELDALIIQHGQRSGPFLVQREQLEIAATRLQLPIGNRLNGLVIDVWEKLAIISLNQRVPTILSSPGSRFGGLRRFFLHLDS